MIAFVVTRFVCPAVTLDNHDNERTKPVVPTPMYHLLSTRYDQERKGNRNPPVIQTEKSNPILFSQGKKLTKNTPRRLGIKYKNPTYARLLGILAAILTPVQMVTISMIPSTHPRSVVCRGVNPNEE